MEVQKAIVDKDLAAAIKCPLCGNIKSFDVAKFKGKTHNIKVKCSCETVFPVSIDFRKSYRKKVNLPGFYSKLLHKGSWNNMNVADLSLTGLALKPAAEHLLQKGEELKVMFKLDDADGALVEKNVAVVNVNGAQIGCEFLDALPYDKAIRRYIISEL